MARPEQMIEYALKERPRTSGEKLFTQYLRLQGITEFEFEKQQEGKNKKIDYTVPLDRQYLFEVKDFANTGILDDGFYDPYKLVREKIGELSKQFREYKDWPCCGVLYSSNVYRVDLNTPDTMFGAMCGDVGITMQLDPASTHVIGNTHRREFLSRGKMLMRKGDGTLEVRNRRISSLITLRQIRWGDEMHLGTIVWENPVARIQFPRGLFCGDCDERYCLNKGSVLRIYAGRGVLEYEAFVGDKLGGPS